MELLGSSMDSFTSLPEKLGLSISLPKCQLCVFSRAWCGMDDISIQVGNTSILCEPTLKNVGIIQDTRLTWVPHIRYITDKAARAANILEIIARVSSEDNLSSIGILSGLTWSGVLLYFTVRTRQRSLSSARRTIGN